MECKVRKYLDGVQHFTSTDAWTTKSLMEGLVDQWMGLSSAVDPEVSHT